MLESLAGAIKFYKARFNIWLNEGRVRALHFVQDEKPSSSVVLGWGINLDPLQIPYIPLRRSLALFV
jgi:hypothetical protein